MEPFHSSTQPPMQRRFYTSRGARQEMPASGGGPRSGWWATGGERNWEWAAARVEQRLGHEKVANLLATPSSQPSSDDSTILGAAWLSEIAELGWSCGSPQALFNKDASDGCYRSGEDVGYRAAGARTQMADVDVRISCGNAFRFSVRSHEHADAEPVDSSRLRKNYKARHSEVTPRAEESLFLWT